MLPHLRHKFGSRYGETVSLQQYGLSMSDLLLLNDVISTGYQPVLQVDCRGAMIRVNKILTIVVAAALMTPVHFAGGLASSMPPLPRWTHSRMNLLTFIIRFVQRVLFQS